MERIKISTQSRKTIRLLAAAALAGVMTSSCASSAKISQFDAFATAGNQYATAMDGLLTESADVMLDANSRKLMWTAAPMAKSASTAEQKEQVKTMLSASLSDQDAVMLANLREIELLRAQVNILSAYFDQLAALSTTNAPDQFSTQLESSVSALNSLSTALSGSSLTQTPAAVQQLSKGLGSLTVKGVQQRALARELEARKTTIAEILRLHQALLGAIRAQIEADEDMVRQREYEVKVKDSILTAVNDQEQWINDRRSLLKPASVSQQLSATMNALTKMQTAWSKLLIGEVSIRDVQSVADDLQPVLSSLVAMKTN